MERPAGWKIPVIYTNPIGIEACMADILAAGYTLDVMGGALYANRQGWNAYVRQGNRTVQWVTGETVAELLTNAHDWVLNRTHEPMNWYQPL